MQPRSSSAIGQRRRVYLIISLICVLQVNSNGIFTKQRRCLKDTAECRDVLAGIVNLDADETYEFQTFSVTDLQNQTALESQQMKDVTVNLKIHKSPLIVSYNLHYEKEVFGGFSEHVHDYAWSVASGASTLEEDDFDPTRCVAFQPTPLVEAAATFKDLYKNGSTVEELLHGGRLCGCKDTGWGGGHYSDVVRSKLNCNAWPAVFRPSSTIWASRHCPQLIGPVYTVYSLSSFRWEYQVDVEIEWILSPAHKNLTDDEDGGSRILSMQRQYHLNWTHPESYDPEFDFRFKITFGIPQDGISPPELKYDHLVLIPKVDDVPASGGNITDEKLLAIMDTLPSDTKSLNSVRDQSLIVRKELVDLSGRTCDKIGVSLYTWSEDGPKPRWVGSKGFCQNHAGDCLRNQPNDLLESDLKRLKGGHSYPKYLLSHKTLEDWSSVGPLILAGPSLRTESSRRHRLLSAITAPAANPAAIIWPTSIAHTTALEVTLNATEITWMTGSAKGAFVVVNATPIDPTKLIRIDCLVKNEDNFPSKFSVHSSPCNLLDEESQLSIDNSELPDSPRSVLIAPVSQTIQPGASETLTVLASKPSGLKGAAYSCQLLLLDSQGRDIGKQDVTISFDHGAREMISLKAPEMSARNVTVDVVPPSADNLSILELIGSPHLRGFESPEIGGGGGRCTCGILNVWCFLGSIHECTQWIRRTAALGLMVFIALGAAALFGPCLISCCCKSAWTGGRLFRNRLSAMAAAAISSVRDNRARGATSDSCCTTNANTPVDRVKDPWEPTPEERLRKAFYQKGEIPKGHTVVGRQYEAYTTSKDRHKDQLTATYGGPYDSHRCVVPINLPVPTKRGRATKEAAEWPTLPAAYRRQRSDSEYFADAERMTSICSSGDDGAYFQEPVKPAPAIRYSVAAHHSQGQAPSRSKRSGVSPVVGGPPCGGRYKNGRVSKAKRSALNTPSCVGGSCAASPVSTQQVWLYCPPDHPYLECNKRQGRGKGRGVYALVPKASRYTRAIKYGGNASSSSAGCLPTTARIDGSKLTTYTSED